MIKVFLQLKRKELVKIRIGQGVFRKVLLSIHFAYELCNVDNSMLLIAIHIKPWRDYQSEERLDKNNGLLLCSNHDMLFGKDLINVDSSGKIVLSTKLFTTVRMLMNLIESKEIVYTFEKNSMRSGIGSMFLSSDL